MALTTTTTSSAVAAGDQIINVTSATGFTAGNMCRCDGEWMKVRQDYVSGTAIPMLRGRDGTVTAAHVSGANITTELASDTALIPSGAGESVTNPPYVSWLMTSYGASGAITFGAAMWTIAVLNGTGTLAMTLANPTKDQDGIMVTVIGNGKSASTLDYPDATGLSNAGSSYDTITFQNAGFCSITHMALNGAWVLLASPPVTGTSTALSIAIS